ncbi:MAG: ATP-dependent 6-phosphofructokinase [Clostridia bacterium]
MKRIGVLTSGGDAPGMNAAIRAVVRQSIFMGFEVVGIRRGFQGIFERQTEDLEISSVADIIKLGGTVLHTGRSRAMLDPGGPAQAVRSLEELGVEGLVVIGGDGSLKGSAKIGAIGLPVVAIPATIDNDVYGVDASIGFDTAVNIVVEAMDRLRDTASAHERVFVIEVMGRESGAIAVAAGLAGGAEAILIPEVPVDYDLIADRLIKSRARGKRHSLVVAAEGAGGARPAVEAISTRTGFEVRMTILGHLQRGGPPSAADRILGGQLGCQAVQSLQRGSFGVMVGLHHGSAIEIPLKEAAHRSQNPDLTLADLAEILAI